jgi:hypothetical protein
VAPEDDHGKRTSVDDESVKRREGRREERGERRLYD